MQQKKKTSAELGKIATRPNYPATLLSIPVGQSVPYPATVRNIQPLRNAASRLNRKRAGLWKVETIKSESGRSYHALITRIA